MNNHAQVISPCRIHLKYFGCSETEFFITRKGTYGDSTENIAVFLFVTFMWTSKSIREELSNLRVIDKGTSVSSLRGLYRHLVSNCIMDLSLNRTTLWLPEHTLNGEKIITTLSIKEFLSLSLSLLLFFFFANPLSLYTQYMKTFLKFTH